MRLVLVLPLLLLSACLLPRSARQVAADEERGRELLERDRSNANAIAARELAETRQQMETEEVREELERRVAAMTPAEREALSESVLAKEAQLRAEHEERRRRQLRNLRMMRADARGKRCIRLCIAETAKCRSQCFGDQECLSECSALEDSCSDACTDEPLSLP